MKETHYDITITSKEEPYYMEEISFSKHPIEGNYLKMSHATFEFFEVMIDELCLDYQRGHFEQDVIIQRSLWPGIISEIKRIRSMIFNGVFNEEISHYLFHANEFMFADEKDKGVYWEEDEHGGLKDYKREQYIDSKRPEMIEMYDVFLRWIGAALRDGKSDIRLLSTYNWGRLGLLKYYAKGNSRYHLNALADELESIEYSAEELMEVAIEAVKAHAFSDEWEEHCRKLIESFGEHDSDSQGWFVKLYKEYDSEYVESIQSHFLIQTLEILLHYGLNPNTCIDTEGRNILFELRFVDVPFLAASAMRLLLEHGADPYILNEDGEALFHDLDADIAMDITLLPDRFNQVNFHCWLVLVGYGARPKEVEPFRLSSGHTYEEFKEFEYYDWKIRFEPDLREYILYIYDVRTGEKVGWL